MNSLRFILVVIFIFTIWDNSKAQDTLSIGGITITSEDSLKARKVLHKEIKPTSRIWTELHNKPGNYRATNKFIQLTSIAYPIKSPKFKTIYVDSILNYMDQVINRHSNDGVRAEFLFKALGLASQMGKEDLANQYYSKIASEYGESHYASRAEEYAPNRAIQKGKKIPKFVLPTFPDTTKSYSNKDFIGHIYLIDFWGTWCGPCIKEMPYLHQAFKKYNKDGFTILSVAMNDSYVAVQNFKNNKWEMPWHHSLIKDDSSLENKVKSQFEVYGFPKTILVGENGDIIATEVDLRGERLLNTLENVIEKK